MQPHSSLHPSHPPLDQHGHRQSPYPPYQGYCTFCCMGSGMMCIFFTIFISMGFIFLRNYEEKGHLTSSLLMFGFATPMFLLGSCCCCFARKERSQQKKYMKEYLSILETQSQRLCGNEMRLVQQSNPPVQVLAPLENLVYSNILLFSQNLREI